MQLSALPQTARPFSPRTVPAVADARATVFILDADQSLRARLAAQVEAAGWEARTFDCAASFLECPAPDGPSCLLLDAGLRGIDGLELQASVTRERSAMAVIFIATQPDIRMTVRAMKAGAVEFLVRPCEEELLLEAIAGAIEHSRTLVGRHMVLRDLRGRYAKLSPRERQVLALVVSGLMNKQVAFELGLSEITVKVHRGRVMEKMQARSLAELVRMSALLGLP